ncbi:MAG: hypothetical protein AAGG79_07080 [Pseudomonadota bacterium]
MKKTTETYEVTEGTDTLEGKPVTAGDPVEMTPTAARYHLALGRLKGPLATKNRPRRKPKQKTGERSSMPIPAEDQGEGV